MGRSSKVQKTRYLHAETRIRMQVPYWNVLKEDEYMYQAVHQALKRANLTEGATLVGWEDEKWSKDQPYVELIVRSATDVFSPGKYGKLVASSLDEFTLDALAERAAEALETEE